MGKIKINETASEPIDMKKSGSNTLKSDFNDSAELMMPIEHYVTVSAKVENTEAGVSVEGVKTAPRKRTTGAKKVTDVGRVSAKSGGSVKASSLKKTAGVTKVTGAAGRKKVLALPAGSIGAAVIDEKAKTAETVTEKKAKLAMDGMVKTSPRTVEVKEAPVSARDEFEAHRPKEKKIKETEEDEKPRFSKPKAVLIGVAVALVVALVGWLVIGLMGRSEPARCIVQFESNGGSKVESEEVVCGEKVERPDDPTKEGFAFQNWIYGGSPFDFEQMTIDEDLILVAKWTAEEGTEVVTIHFDTAGGSEIEDIEVKKGSTVTAPVEPTRESYKFVGWKLDGEDFDFSQPVEEDITLVAEWEPLVGGGNSGSSDNSGAAPQKPSVESLAASDTAIMVGMTKMIDVTVNPSNADYKLAVSSSNASVAVCSVTDDARLKCEGKGVGETTVMVRDVLSGRQTQFKITGTSEVTFVSLDRTTLSLTVGGSSTLSANVTASGGVSVATTWTSSNPSVATVRDGIVTAVAAGTATITVTAGGLSASCVVTVSPFAPVNPPTDPDPPVNPNPENPDPDAGGDATTMGN